MTTEFKKNHQLTGKLSVDCLAEFFNQFQMVLKQGQTKNLFYPGLIFCAYYMKLNSFFTAFTPSHLLSLVSIVNGVKAAIYRI